jgi:hypothetical protein
VEYLLDGSKSRASRVSGIEIVAHVRIERIADAEGVKVSIGFVSDPTSISVHGIEIPLDANVTILREAQLGSAISDIESLETGRLGVAWVTCVSP